MSSHSRHLGKYEIVRPLAEGGMAELWLGRSTGIAGFEKLVVLKRIRPELVHQPGLVEMFLDEARLAATLHHSNVVQVYDIGQADGGPFFAMEYLQGENVRSLMRAGRAIGRKLPLEHALSIAIGVCAGLHYAHEISGSDGRPLGIVHRDISPQNIAVTYGGGVKVLDFGIAKAARRLTETRAGQIKGKIQYLSPEQCRCDPIDRRADVFAICIVLWEMTTERQLYVGKSDLAIMKAITEADAPLPSRLVPGYPAELERIVRKGLARAPEERFQTAEELQLALEAFARAERLALSPAGLGRYMRELFAPRTATPGLHLVDDAELPTQADLRVDAEAPLVVAATEGEGGPTATERVRPLTRATRRPPQRDWRWPVAGVTALTLAAVGAWWAAVARLHAAIGRTTAARPAIAAKQHVDVAMQQGGVAAQHGGVAAQPGGVAAQQGGVAMQQGGVAAQHGVAAPSGTVVTRGGPVTQHGEDVATRHENVAMQHVDVAVQHGPAATPLEATRAPLVEAPAARVRPVRRSHAAPRSASAPAPGPHDAVDLDDPLPPTR